MATGSKKPKGRDNTLSALTMAIEGLTLVKEVSTITPAKAAFCSVGIILTTIKVRFLVSCSATSPRFTFSQEFMINEDDYVSLGMYFNDICQILNRGTNGKRLEDLNESAREAVKQLTA